jgi:hypothetical protein
VSGKTEKRHSLLSGCGVCTRRNVLPPGNSTGSNQYKAKEETSIIDISLQPARAEKNGVGLRTQIKLDRIARERPDLHEEVQAGHLTIHRVSIQAGFVKEASLLSHAQDY